MYIDVLNVVNVGRSAQRKNNDTDGRAAVDREGEEKILETRPNDYIYIYNAVWPTTVARSWPPLPLPSSRSSSPSYPMYNVFFPPLYFFPLFHFLFFTTKLTPFIIGVYFERDNVEPFQACHSTMGT